MLDICHVIKKTSMRLEFKLLSLFLMGMISLNAQQKNETFNVTVNISNFKNNKGLVLVSLCNTKETFLVGGIKSAKLKITNKSCSITFKDLPKGTYAISMFHDENENNKLDTNFLGIPKESYGCSNNARGHFGPPKWEDAKFEINHSNIIQNIKL